VHETFDGGRWRLGAGRHGGLGVGRTGRRGETGPQAAGQARAGKGRLTFHNEGLIEAADGKVVYFYRTNFIDAKTLIAAVGSMGVKDFGGTLALKPVGTNANVVLLEGDPDAVEIVLDLLTYFDVSKPQVFIETKVIEVTYDSNFEFGVDYLHDRDIMGSNTFFRGAAATLNPPSFLRSGFAPGFPFQGSSTAFGFVTKMLEKYGAFDVNFQVLQVNGKAEVLSKPSIIATQGEKATVLTEEATPIVALNFADRNNEQFRTATVKTGVKLEVTPEHIGDQFVTLSVMPEIKGAAALAATRPGGTFAPIQTTRSASTQVTLGDGETLVIGGLYTNQSTTEKAKTPLFSELPLVGDLFTRTKETKQKTELIFILTPHIVRKTNELKIVVPPKELERLEGAADRKKGCNICGKPLPLPKPCIPKPPGWGAQFEDD
jgi:type II secretory pathway component GspD/PulD (secretin)